MKSLTAMAKLAEELTHAQNEISRLRTQQERAGRATPGAASTTWAAATARLPPEDRRRIDDAVNAARNIFRWARRRRRLENTRWQHGDPAGELRVLAKLARREKTRKLRKAS